MDNLAVKQKLSFNLVATAALSRINVQREFSDPNPTGPRILPRGHMSRPTTHYRHKGER
jgi:hypothetical protein